MHLSEMRIGDKALIVKIISGEKVYRQQLISMGLIPGTEITLSRIAPLGDPIEINVRGFYLSLRKNEASLLELKEIA